MKGKEENVWSIAYINRVWWFCAATDIFALTSDEGTSVFLGTIKSGYQDESEI